MRHADKPSGPGKPIKERRDAVAAQEESDEMARSAETEGTEQPPADPGENARHADRNAHANPGRDGAGDNASGGT
jgi:hypothetical protein